ncbi:hypothetical protein [Mesorhizobium mediterraneum]|uniref:hypothetical protein n=1 Tax=Mesorhizobium mediterraneum TaxID=43617 RepID=UPI0017803CC8|nr:hypothetical protein [Mesorhizobium mediterraneum]
MKFTAFLSEAFRVASLIAVATAADLIEVFFSSMGGIAKIIGSVPILRNNKQIARLFSETATGSTPALLSFVPMYDGFCRRI